MGGSRVYDVSLPKVRNGKSVNQALGRRKSLDNIVAKMMIIKIQQEEKRKVQKNGTHPAK